jgi:hypothetical protein
MVTRMKAAANITTKNGAENVIGNKNKRKADTILTSVNKKRSAFGDITNVSYSSVRCVSARMNFHFHGNRQLARPRITRK